MNSFCYIILQYGCSRLTAACIDSIRAFSDARIVVVDNASPDNALAEIRLHLADDRNSAVLALPENVGFSMGNNAGVAFAREEGGFDFYCVLNSDVVIEQPDFETRVKRAFENTGCAVLGPDIFVPSTGWHQNPFHHIDDGLHPENPTLRDVATARRALEEAKRSLEVGQVPGNGGAHFLMGAVKSNPFLYKVGLGLKKLLRGLDYIGHWNRAIGDTALQGACLIFSQRAIDGLGKPFAPPTFLYCEEWILRINCARLGLKMAYDPRIKVTHLEGSSTAGGSDKTSTAKRLFMVDKELESLDIVEALLRGDGVGSSASENQPPLQFDESRK